MRISRSLRRFRPPSLVVAEPLEIRRLLAANLLISEFMASNSKTLKDQAGDYPDWIEIHNAGDADANLNDYFLTDNAGNPEEWRFPVQTLAAGAYLVVFADGTDVAVAGQELHTNFKLSADGEYLGLINAADDSVQFAYSPSYPAQTADISYGLSDSNDPNSALTFFSVPTPGAANAPSVAEPTFSQAGIVFTGTLMLTLSDATPNAVIHYTTDDSVPTASSPTYTAPISLTKSEAIRVIATASGLTSSPVTSQTYERVDSTVTGVANQNLPVIIIDTYGGTMQTTSDSDIAGSATVMNTSNGTTNILGTADYQGRIGIHIRGSTSEGYPKQQYLLNIWDENNNGKNVSLLGMPADSSWVLYAPYTELSLMQNPLAFQLANAMGEYASRTQFVEVYLSTGKDPDTLDVSNHLNTTTITYGNNYIGIYVLQEKIQIDSDRVNVDEISASNPNGGFIVDQDRYTGDNYFISKTEGVHLDYNDPGTDPTISTANPVGNIATSWDNFERALFNTGWNDPTSPNYYGNFINIRSFVDYFLIEELTKNVDAFWLSTYYTKAADTTVNGVTTTGLISAGPVWDFNLSMGATNYQDAANSEGWDTYQLSPYSGAAGVSGFNPQDPYFQRLLADPNFVQDLTDRWDQLRQGVLSTPNIDADIQANINLLSDNTGVYPVGTNNSILPTDSTSSPVMRNFEKWPELGVFVTTDGMYDPSITTNGVTTGGSWIKDVDLMENWLSGRLNWMDSQFSPEPTITPGGDFGAPVSVTMSPAGRATVTDTQLIGPNSTVQYMVPTSTNNPSNWYLPSFNSSSWPTGPTGIGYGSGFASAINTSVATGTKAPGLVMQGISSSLYLRTTFNINDPTQIEALILKVQYDDGFIAWVNGVRVMDANSGENTNPIFTTTAGGATSNTAALTYREFDISSIDGLLVAGTNTLAIQGLNVSRNDSDFLLAPTLYSRTYNYPATGTVYYTTNGTDPMGSNGQPSASAQIYNGAIALSSSTEIKARTYNAGAADPFNPYTGQSASVPWGGLTDQVYDFQSDNLRITELMYDPASGGAFSAQEYEYVELQNVSSIPLDLDGYAFTNGVAFTFPNEMLAPGAYGVVVKDAPAFASRYGNSPNVLGTYTGSFDNSGEKVELDDGFGQEVESFHYQPTWYPTTTGGGTSLVVLNPAENDTTLGTAAGWRASFTNDGAPGYADIDTTTPTVASFSVNDGGAGDPTVQFTFDTYISSGSSGTFTVISKQTGQSVAVAGFTIDGDVLTLSLPSTLASGAYQFTLPAGAVENASAIANSTSTIDTILLIRAGQTWSLPPAESGLVVNSLAFGAGSTLDVGTSTLSVAYNGANPAGTIAQMIASGYADGTWAGIGITSANAAADTTHTIGVASFDDGTEIKIARTWNGDTNLDGQINADDLSLMLLGQVNNRTRWQDGNFNYDSAIDQDDWSKLAYALAYSNGQPLSLSNVIIAAVTSGNTTKASTNALFANNLRLPAFGITPITVADETNELLDTPQTIL